MHTYLQTFVITYTSIHTYSANRNPNMCIHTKSNANKHDSVRICSSLLRSMFQSQKQKRTLHAGKRFIFGRDKHTKLRTYSYIHTYIQQYIHIYINMYILHTMHTYNGYLKTYIHYIHAYIYDTYIHTYIHTMHTYIHI